MTTTTGRVSPTSTHAAARSCRAALLLTAVVGALSLTACNVPTVGVSSYPGFSSAVHKGAGCRDLFDMRARLHKTDDLTRAEADLVRIGCSSAGAVRTSR